MTKREKIRNFKIIVWKLYSKCDRYCKVRWNLQQSVTRVTNCHKKSLGIVAGIKQCENHYKFEKALYLK